MKPGLVTVGFLHPGHYSSCFAESMQDVILTDIVGKQRIVSHSFGKLGKQVGSGGIVAGRNAIAKAVVEESESEWLWFIDSDMGFAGDALEQLIASAHRQSKPIMGGLAFACKTDGKASFYGIRYRATPTVYRWYEDDEQIGFVPDFQYPRDTVVECSATGAACVLIHRTVLEAVADKYGGEWFSPVTHPRGTTFSEDLSFCIRAAACGFPIHVNTAVKTTHDKGAVFLDEEYYERQQYWLAEEGRV